MFNEQDTKSVCQTVFAFKANAYSASLQEILSESDRQKPQDLSFKESLSRFFIELYNILDACSKDLPTEDARNAFWKTAEEALLDSSHKWLKELSSKSPFIQENEEEIAKDIQEFQKRAINFHKERQRFSRSYKQQIA